LYGYVSLAPHFENSRRFLAGQLQRHGANGFEVGRYVVPCPPVATSGPTGEAAIFVTHADGDPVRLRLKNSLVAVARPQLVDQRAKLAQLVFSVGLVQGQRICSRRNSILFCAS